MHSFLVKFLVVVCPSFAHLQPLLFIDGVISAWARIGETAKAEQVLWRANEMQKKCKSLVLDVVTYNSIVHGYLRDDDKDNSLSRILRIVDYMNKHKDGKDQAWYMDLLQKARRLKQ